MGTKVRNNRFQNSELKSFKFKMSLKVFNTIKNIEILTL